MAMAAIMITMVVNLLETAQRASGSLVASNQAKVALDFIAQDLESAIFIPDGKSVCLVATVQPDQATAAGNTGASMASWTATSGGVTKPGNTPVGAANASYQLAPVSEELRDYRFGMAGVWLRLFTVEPDSNVTGELNNFSVMRAVAYQIVRYEVQAGGSLRYGLFRSTVQPNDIFPIDYSFLYWGDGTTVTPYNEGGNPPAGEIRRPSRDQLLTNNVIDFGLRFWRRTSVGGQRLLFPSNAAGNPSNLNGGFAVWAGPADSGPIPPNPTSWEPVGGAEMAYGFPDVAEIFLRVLTDEGAKQLEAFERGQLTGTTWWDLAIANSQVYTRRVEIKGKTL